MTWGIRAWIVIALAAAAFEVHRVRSRLAAHDADPAAVARMSAGFHSIPMDLDGGHYVGSEYGLGSRIVEASGADVFLSTQYREKSGSLYRLYVGGSIANDENFHAPSYCMPAAGWEIVEESTVPFVAYSVQDDDARMRRLLLQHGANRMLVYYWFQAGDRIADHEWSVRYARLWDLLGGKPLRPTIILVLYAPVGGDIVTAESGAQGFLRAVGPFLRQATVQ